MFIDENMIEDPHSGLSMAQLFAREVRVRNVTYPLFVYVEGNGSFHASEEAITVSDVRPRTGPGTFVYGEVVVVRNRRELMQAVDAVKTSAIRRACEAFKLSRNAD